MTTIAYLVNISAVQCSSGLVALDCCALFQWGLVVPSTRCRREVAFVVSKSNPVMQLKYPYPDIFG